jgi:hypothetical protein
MTSQLTIAHSLAEIGRMDPRQMERAVTYRDLDFELDRASWYRYQRDKAGVVYRVQTTPRSRLKGYGRVGPYAPGIRGSVLERAHTRGSGMGNGSYAELIYSNIAAGTAKNTFTTEFQINDTAAMGPAPVIPAFYYNPQVGIGKTLRIIADVIQLGTASTPPTWQVIHRLNPVVTPAVPPTGPNVGGMTAGVTGTTTASTLWRSELDVQATIFGAAGNNSTLRGTGMVWSPTGFVSPFMAALLGGGASPGTVATFDFSLLNTLTYGVVCGTSLAANQVQLIGLLVIGLN